MDPEDFQRQLAQRTAEEQAKMAEFRAHEEKMKKYQEAKKKGGRPPLGKEGSSLQVNT